MLPTVKLIELVIRRDGNQLPARGGERAAAATLARDGGRAEARRRCGQFPRQDVSGRGRASSDLADSAAQSVRHAVTLLLLVRGQIEERSPLCLLGCVRTRPGLKSSNPADRARLQSGAGPVWLRVRRRLVTSHGLRPRTRTSTVEEILIWFNLGQASRDVAPLYGTLCGSFRTRSLHRNTKVNQ